MKKIIIYALIGFLCMNFAGCKETVKSYETNESDKYIDEKTHRGGDKDSKRCELEKIRFHRWTGSEKIILTFNGTETTPYHVISYDENEKKIKVDLTNVMWENADLEDYSKSDAIDNMVLISDPSEKSNLWVIFQLKDKVQYRIDEECGDNQIVINLKTAK